MIKKWLIEGQKKGWHDSGEEVTNVQMAFCVCVLCWIDCVYTLTSVHDARLMLLSIIGWYGWREFELFNRCLKKHWWWILFSWVCRLTLSSHIVKWKKWIILKGKFLNWLFILVISPYTMKNSIRLDDKSIFTIKLCKLCYTGLNQM